MVSLFNLTVAEDGLHPLELGYLIISEFLNTIVSQPLKGHVAHPHQQVLGPNKGRSESIGGEIGVKAENKSYLETSLFRKASLILSFPDFAL